MTMPVMQNDRPTDQSVDTAQLWPGGIKTAVVARPVALVGVLASGGSFNVQEH
jgi:hypothetical protein